MKIKITKFKQRKSSLLWLEFSQESKKEMIEHFSTETLADMMNQPNSMDGALKITTGIITSGDLYKLSREAQTDVLSVLKEALN